jgi:hypothetical protein
MPASGDSKVWEDPDDGLWVVQMEGMSRSPASCRGGAGHPIGSGRRYLVLDELPGGAPFPTPVKGAFCGKDHVVEFLRMAAENTQDSRYRKGADWIAGLPLADP